MPRPKPDIVELQKNHDIVMKLLTARYVEEMQELARLRAGVADLCKFYDESSGLLAADLVYELRNLLAGHHE